MNGMHTMYQHAFYCCFFPTVNRCNKIVDCLQFFAIFFSVYSTSTGLLVGSSLIIFLKLLYQASKILWKNCSWAWFRGICVIESASGFDSSEVWQKRRAKLEWVKRGRRGKEEGKKREWRRKEEKRDKETAHRGGIWSG